MNGALVRATDDLIFRAPVTLTDHAPRFLGWLRLARGRSENSVRAYGFDLRSFIDFCARADVHRPAEVTFRTIDAYLGYLQYRGLRPTSANRHLHAIRTLFKYLRREGITTADPAADVFGLRESKRLPKFLTIPEQERVLAILAADATPIGCRDHALVATALFCGLRVHELANARLEDLDLDAGVLRVIGKGDKQRECVVIPRLATILRDYLTNVRPPLMTPQIRGGVFVMRRTWFAEYVLDGRTCRFSTGTCDEAEARAVLAERLADLAVARTSPYVFVRAGRRESWQSRHGQPLDTKSVFLLIRRRLTPLLGRPVHPHMLRHSFAVRLREGNADIQLIQEALGHADIKTTTIYAHISTGRWREQIARLLE